MTSLYQLSTETFSGWLIDCFGRNGTFETVFQCIPGLLLERGRMKT